MQSVIASARERVKSPAAQDAFKRWFDAAPLYSGSILANRFGWQVIRTMAKRVAIETRRTIRHRRAPQVLAETLERDGIVVIPNYLSEQRYADISRAFGAYSSSPRLRDIGDENGASIGYVTGPVISEGSNDAAFTINSILGTDEVIVALAEHAIGRKVRTPLRIIYQRLRIRDGDVDDFDREQILHADKAFPCIKAIYILDAISDRSSPFVYCPGSHRVTRERLRYEHVMGVREALLRAGRVSAFDPADGIDFVRSRNVMGGEFRKRLGIEERPMVCGANTLIITNNAGFHRRGRLEPGEVRRTLWINFYPYQRPWYGKLAFRAAKSVVDTDNVPRALQPIHRQSVDAHGPNGSRRERDGR